MTTDYNSFIEILTGINLAYAGSERFRDFIDQKILSIFSSFQDMKNAFLLNAGLNTADASTVYLQELNTLMQTRGTRTMDVVNKKTDCSEIFKSAFLFAGGYCLVFLICSASMTYGVHVKESRTILLLLSIVTILYSLVIVTMSVIKSTNKKIKAYKPILLLLTTIITAIIISRCDCTHYIEEFALYICNVERKYFLYLALIAAVSPIVLHLLRSLIILFYAWLMTRREYWVAMAINYDLELTNYKLYSIDVPKRRMLAKLFYSNLFLIIKHRHDKKLSRG